MNHPVAPESAPPLAYDRTIDGFLTTHGERPALGERVYTVDTDPASGQTTRRYQPEYRTLSYQALQQRVQALAMAWREDGPTAVPSGAFVGLVGFANVDYAVLDLALAYAKAIPVPLSRHYATAEFDDIFRQTQPVALAVSITYLPELIELAARQPSLRSLIVFDFDDRIHAERRIIADARRTLQAHGSRLEIVPLRDLIEHGKSAPFQPLPADLQGPDDTALLIHTSGSTGQPKGACIPAKALLNTWQTVSDREPNLTVILAPFHHMMGRDCMYSTLNAGGTAYFTLKPDLSTLFDDIRLCDPTVLFLFPRICEMIYHHFQNAPPASDSTGSDFLGNRLQDLFVSSAPLLPKIKRFLAETFRVPVHVGYSSTETASGGLAMDGRLNRRNVLAYRLRDVPEHGYFTTDRPYPRGELCVKTRFGIRAYFNNPEATANLFDEDGFSCTGDVVEERGPDLIAIIDRRANVLKLSQGEYVAVGKLGVLFEQHSPLIHQCYVHGESHRSYLLAVVVPRQEAIQCLDDPPSSEADLKALLRREMQRIAQENELRHFEIPRDLIVADEPFSQKNGLLSSVSKYLRPAIRSRYAPALETLYQSHERRRQKELDALRQASTPVDGEAKLVVLLNATLGVPCADEDRTKTFQQLGGDSLAAVQLSILIEKEFGVSITGDQILGPQGSLTELVGLIKAQTDPQGTTRPAVQIDAIHGSSPDELHADDLKLADFIGAETIQRAASLPLTTQPPTTILLTGATGFLGGRTALAWLEKLAGSDRKLICLVRSSSTQSARERLDARFAHLPDAIAARYRPVFEKHLEVVAGDLSLPLWGMDTTAYRRLAGEVDAICHGAALVNHVLAYEHLFRPNVIGTAEVIRFALTERRKPVQFISTIGVAPWAQSKPDGAKPHSLSTRLPLDKSYAKGYFASKWACEHLLQAAHQEADLPISVVRPALIMPDQELPGEFNPDDILSRLFYSIVVTGLAPASFPPPHEHGFQLDGLPVDVLANALVASMMQGRPSASDHDVLHAGSGPTLSLDALLSWIESAGHSLRHLPDYEDWLTQVEKELATRPRDEQTRSLLGLAEAYRTEPATASTSQPVETFPQLLTHVEGEQPAPFFTESYVHKYLRDFSDWGLLPSESSSNG